MDGTVLDPEQVVITEEVEGSDIPVHLMYVETRDGLYAPIGLRTPPGEGPFPLVLLASGNGGEGMPWIRHWVRTRGFIMDRLLEAGFACKLRDHVETLSPEEHRQGLNQAFLVIDQKQ